MDDYGKSSIGLEEGVVASASYFCALGLILLIIEKRSSFVKFHALQSTLAYSLLLIWWMLVKWVPALHFMWWSPGLIALGFTAYMAYRAYYGEEYRLPVLGNLAFNTVYDTESEDFLATQSPGESANSNQTGGSG